MQSSAAQRPCSAAAGRDPVTCAAASSGGRLELMLGGPTAHTGAATPPGKPPNRLARGATPVSPLPHPTPMAAVPVGHAYQLAFLACRVPMGLTTASPTARFSCGPASVTFAAHISARRGRQLEPVLGAGPGHPPPHARTAHHGATWPPCRRCPPPHGLPHPPRRRKPPLLTPRATPQRRCHRAGEPSAAARTHSADYARARGGLFCSLAQRPGSAAAALTREHSRPHAQAVGWNPVLGHGIYRRCRCRRLP
jgi:hypothetical protein